MAEVYQLVVVTRANDRLVARVAVSITAHTEARLRVCLDPVLRLRLRDRVRFVSQELARKVARYSSLIVANTSARVVSKLVLRNNVHRSTRR